MKILIVSASDIQGGAGRAAFRLHNALLDAGINSSMLVQRKRSSVKSVIGPKNKFQELIGMLRPHIDNLPLKLYRNKTGGMFSILWLPFSSFPKKINAIDPDIVHMHWLDPGMLSIKDFQKINAPIVWSLHDMWIFTGGCHYDEGCDGYSSGCGNCKVLGSKIENDLSKKVFKRKEKIFPKIKSLTIIGLSQWLENCSKKSGLFKNDKVLNLPNPIDTDIFKPQDKVKSKRSLGLPLNKKLVLYGAMWATSDPRKGFRELSEAMKKLTEIDVEFVVFGSDEPKNDQGFGFKTHYLGRIDSDEYLANLYSAVDVMIVPSLQENLSNAIMESLACGTPVVGFDIGGNSDMIEQKKNGYLAVPFESESLKAGIEWVLNSPNYDQLRQNARDKVMREFDSKVVSKKYIDLYQQILK